MERASEDGAVRHTLLGWAKDEPAGTEFAEVKLWPGELRASGVAVGTDPLPYRVRYELTASAEFVTNRLWVTSAGSGWSRTLDLRREDRGTWTAETTTDGAAPLPQPGGDTAAFAAALDVDVQQSPLFNTPPVLRHRLHEDGDAAELLMVWVSLPDLAVHPSRQRYTRMGKAAEGRVVRFESLDGDFAAEIVLDDDGLVVDYPGVGYRVLTDAGRRPDQSPAESGTEL